MSLTVVMLAAPCASIPASAATIAVNSTSLAVVQGDGQCTLIEAMENARTANAGFSDCAAGSTDSNVIELQSGQTYTLAGAWTNPGTVAALALPIVTRALTINGHGSTLRPGTNAGAFRVLYVSDEPVAGSRLTLNDVTIRDFVLPDRADGGVFNDNSLLIINRSTFRGMRVEAGGSGGGAVTSRACAPEILAACTTSRAASLTVTDSVFEDNESRSADGAFGAGAAVNTYAVGPLTGSFTTILRSRFHANTATNRGGAIANGASDSGTSEIEIQFSSITGNTTTGGIAPASGGGMANVARKHTFNGPFGTSAALSIVNTTIAGNIAANGSAGNGYGGAIFNELDCAADLCGSAGTTIALTNVTMYGNVAGRDPSGAERGAALWSNSNGPTDAVDLTVLNSLIAGNLANGTRANCRITNARSGIFGFPIASDNSCGEAFRVFTEAQINLAPLNVTRFTYYHAPQPGSVAIDKAFCTESFDQLGTPRPIGPTCDVGAIESSPASGRRAISDFNGDGRSDAGIFRPSVLPNALWYSEPSVSGAPFQIHSGVAGDIPVPADYDGDGKTDAVTWRPSTGLWVGPRTGSSTLVTQFVMGQNGDLPVPCDYDGDGAADPAVYRPGTGQWFGTRANGTTVVLNTNLGVRAGDIPVPADYNGDGRCDPAIMRPGVGPGGANVWFSVPSGGGPVFQIFFGAPGDIPVPADYDGDGKADAVIFRPSTGLWVGPRNGGPGLVTQIVLGQIGDIPVPGDYDGDGATDPAFYRPSTGLFFATTNTFFILNTTFGVTAGDIPTAVRPHNQPASPFMTTSVPGHGAVPENERRAHAAAPERSARGGTDTTLRTPGEIAAPLPDPAPGQARRSPAIRPEAALPRRGTRRALTFTVVDPRGATNIHTIYTSIQSASRAAASCLIAYDVALSTLRLADDTTTQWSPALAVGAHGTVSNSQCTVHGADSAVSADATTLTLAISITFEPAFAADTTAYGLAMDAGGGSSGWQWLGRRADPSVRSLSGSMAPLPANSASAQTFTHTVSVPSGASDLDAIYLMVNSSLSAAGSCLIAYDPATNTLQLADDAGTSWSSPVTVGGQGPIANSQCAVEPAGGAVFVGAGTFTLSIPITFHARFAGPKNVYGLAVNASGASSLWQLLGIWTVPDVAAPLR